MKKEWIIVILLIAVSLALTLIGYLNLPDPVIVQFNFKGEVSNTMSKTAAVTLPFAITLVSAIFYGIRKESKLLLISIIGIAVSAMTLFFNLH